MIVPKFGLDLGIFTGGGNACRSIFIEAKSYGGQRQGGIGFGKAERGRKLNCCFRRTLACLPNNFDGRSWNIFVERFVGFVSPAAPTD